MILANTLFPIALRITTYLKAMKSIAKMFITGEGMNLICQIG